MGWIILVIIIVVVAFAFVGVYNRLVTARNAFKNAFAQIDVQLTRRYDLIPNLVETAKGYMKHERETLEAVIQARNSAMSGLKAAAANPADAGAVAQLQGAEAQLGSALGRLFALSEAYPDLKANANFQSLQAQLEGTENRIAVARRDFNEAVLDYNTTAKRFPTVILASLFRFAEKPYFRATPESATPPKVEFNFGRTNPAPVQ